MKCLKQHIEQQQYSFCDRQLAKIYPPTKHTLFHGKGHLTNSIHQGFIGQPQKKKELATAQRLCHSCASLFEKSCDKCVHYI